MATSGRWRPPVVDGGSSWHACWGDVCVVACVSVCTCVRVHATSVERMQTRHSTRAGVCMCVCVSVCDGVRVCVCTECGAEADHISGVACT